MIQSSSGTPCSKNSDDDLCKIPVWTDNADGESTVKYNRENKKNHQFAWLRQVIIQRKKLPHFTQTPACYYEIFASARKHI